MPPSKKKAASAKQKAAKAKKDAATRDLSHVLRNQPAGITVTDAQHDANSHDQTTLDLNQKAR